MAERERERDLKRGVGVVALYSGGRPRNLSSSGGEGGREEGGRVKEEDGRERKREREGGKD